MSKELDDVASRFMPNRRSLLRTAALGGLAASTGLLLPRRAHAAGTLTVGWVYVGPKNDFGFNQAHHEAVEALKSTPGVKVLEEENVPETEAVEQTMQSMINFDGADLLFLTSFGYFDHMVKVAPKFPKVQFRHQGLLWKPTDPANTGSLFRLHQRGIVWLWRRGRHGQQDRQARLHRRPSRSRRSSAASTRSRSAPARSTRPSRCN